MSQEPIDYEAVLVDLETKRTALDAAIAALRQAVSVGAQATIQGMVVTRTIDPLNIPDDAFFGLSIGEAAKKYLGMVKRKQSVKEIAEALDRGGLPHSSTNFLATVATMLSRTSSTDPELVKVGREWGLSAWYGSRRPKDPEPKGSAKRRSRHRQRKKPKLVAHGKDTTPKIAKRARKNETKAQGSHAEPRESH